MISNAQRILKLVRFFSILLLLHTTICPDTRYALADNKNVQIYLLRSRKRANLQTYFRFTCGKRKSIINFMLRTPSTFSTVVQKILLARSTRFTEDWYIPAKVLNEDFLVGLDGRKKILAESVLSKDLLQSLLKVNEKITEQQKRLKLLKWRAPQ